LSKRTKLYTALAYVNVKDGLDTPLAGSKFDKGFTSGNTTGLDLGIVHSF